MSLKDVQEEMKRRITQGNASGGVDPRIGVYREGYVARIAEALQETYETVYKVLGGTDFFQLAGDFIRKYPSSSYNLFDVGEKFPIFIKESAILKDFPFLYDMACFEWAIAKSFHAKWEDPLDERKFHSIPPEKFEQVHFSFQPCMQLISSDWGLSEIRDLRKKEEVEIDVDSFLKPSDFLIYRKEFQVMVLPISPTQMKVYRSLFNRKSVGEALQGVDGPVEEKEVGAWFSLIRELQLMTGIETTLSKTD